MATATTLATLTVISGPDQGKTFSLADEVVHVGRSDDCQVLLSDVSLDSVQVSFANRNNRFAVFTSLKEGVKVDGKGIPIEQWVWLPSRATLQISSNTTLQFTANGTDTAELKESRPTDGRANSPAKETSAPGTAPSKGRKKGSKKNESTSRTVAKFITDRAGETLVRLGEDGHLPELTLTESESLKAVKHKRSKEGNPAFLYGLLGISLLASVAMLFLDADMTSSQFESKSSVRAIVMSEFIGSEKGAIKPYQQLLRDAGLANSRHDNKTERQAYLKVLELLNAEDKNPYTGLTGDLKDDERLRKYLATLLK